MRWTAVVLMLVAGPAVGQTVVDDTGNVLPPGAAAKLPQIFRSALVDPTSAQISELKPAADGMFCGAVNAKNQFGGYAGARAFVLDLSGSEVFIFPTIIPGKSITPEEGAPMKKALDMLMRYCVKK